MKKAKRGLVLIAAVMFVAAPAMATLVVDPWVPPNPPGELNLYEIVNALYGVAYTSSADMLFAQVAAPLDEVFSGGQTIQATARYATFVQTFGWYQYTGAGDPTNLVPLLYVEDYGLGDWGTVTIAPVGDYGFYDQVGPEYWPDRYTWYSESDENRRGEDHMVLYDLGLLVDASYAGGYLMGWEDERFCSSDLDYNDLVLELAPAGGGGPVIPEPTTMVLLGLGVAGMLFRRLRSA